MQQYFVPPMIYNTSADTSVFGTRHPAFEVIPPKMDETWLATFGCADLGPAPNTPAAQRHHLDVTAICKAAGIPLPPDFVDRPHLGGSSCPACNWIASNQGFGPMRWFIHPADKAAPAGQAAKPPGRQCGYVHQIFRCGSIYAIAHVLIRTDRDAGRGDVNAHLLQRREA